MPDLIGSEFRASNRLKKKVLVERKAKAIIDDTLTCLEKSDPPEAAYRSQLKTLLPLLKQYFVSSNDFIVARRCLSQHIDSGNADGKWSLPVPAYPIRMTTRKNFRNKKWFQIMGEIAEEYEKLCNYLDSDSPMLSEKDTLAMCLLSSAIHGGLCSTEYLLAFANQLINEKKPFFRHEGKYWVDISVESSLAPSNMRRENGDEYCIRRWFPDTHSMMWAYKFRREVNKFEVNRVDASQVLTWIRSLFRLSSPEFNLSTNSLGVFLKSCVGITEMLEGVSLPTALSQYAIGDVQSSSLPPNQYSQINQNPGQLNLTGVSLLEFGSFDQIGGGGGVRKKSSKLPRPTAYLLRELRRAFKDPIGSVAKLSPVNVVQSLKELRSDQEWPEMVSVLIDWLIDLLAVKKLKVSSAKRYFSSVGSAWLRSAVSFDPLEKEADDFMEIYDEMLDSHLSEKNRIYAQDRLYQLHDFGTMSLGWPCLPDASRNRSGSGYPFVNAGYIPKEVYRALLDALGSFTDLREQDKAGLKCLAIIAMRTGLRKSEILKLRLTDIEESEESYLFIKNNRYGDNKSSSSLRKIPLEALLIKSEMVLVQSYIQSRRRVYGRTPQALLFSKSSSPILPLNGHQITRAFNFILRNLSGVNYTFHHFRHTALSNFQVALSSNAHKILNAYRLFDGALADQIRILIYGKNSFGSHRDDYWAVAGLAGHLSPETTLSCYLHFSDVLLADALAEQVTKRSARYLSDKIGIPAYAVTRIRKNAEQSGGKISSGLIPVALFDGYLSKKMARFSYDIGSTAQNSREVQNYSGLDVVPCTESLIESAIQTLKLYEEGLSTFEISDMLFDEGSKQGQLKKMSDIQRYIDNAKRLATIKTNKGASRFVPSTVSPVLRGLNLSPSRPRTMSDLQDADQIITSLRSQYINHKTSISWCIGYFINHTDTSSSSIKFTNKADLDMFLGTMLLVTKANRWHIRFTLQPGCKREWKSGLHKKISTDVAASPKTQKNRAELHFLNVNSKSYSTANGSFEKYSSNSLRYVFHLLGVVVGPF